MSVVNEQCVATQTSGELLDPGNASFPDIAAQEQLYGCSRDIAEYCAKEAVGNVVLLDRSIRPAATALTTYWDMVEMPWSERPNLQFFTPDSRWHPIHNAPLRSALFTPVRVLTSLTARQVGNQLEKVASPLLDQKDEPVLLFDACLHTGKTVARTKRVFEKLGFEDVRLGVCTAHEATGRKLEAEFVYQFTDTQEPSLLSCKPFGKYPGVDSRKNHIFTVPTGDRAKRTKAEALRSDIRRVVRAGFERDQAQR